MLIVAQRVPGFPPWSLTGGTFGAKCDQQIPHAAPTGQTDLAQGGSPVVLLRDDISVNGMAFRSRSIHRPGFPPWSLFDGTFGAKCGGVLLCNAATKTTHI